ncbi:HicB-like protein involved in pilus formation [Kribbella sp. VKM Ac-2527]|uniref:HicB-like protein involved in pilus formation n=2 Tax=Kribbella caucasensis TaxID=2512215 RepID=A0A4R6J5J7_9ACTN|nr:HicB-like protein involved in pilus formation [Kribbella sp. VKM Ac-2527]
MRPCLVGAVRLLATSHLEMGSRTNTEEVTPMVEPTNEASGVKTLGVRVPGELHPQFVLVAKLDGLSLNDACVRGIELYVESRQSEPDFKARVAAVLEEIEQEANSRRSAIQALLGPAAPATADKPAAARRRGKGTTQ